MTEIEKIYACESFQTLKRKRNFLGRTLTAVILLAYYGYILLIAFKKEWLAARIGESFITVGVVVGFGLIILTVALTGYYVFRANREFDDLNDKALKEMFK